MKKTIMSILTALHLKEMAFSLNTIIKQQSHSLKRSVRKAFIGRLSEKRQKSGVLAIEISNRQGLGAKLEYMLELLAYCDEKKLKPLFRFSYPGSGDYFDDYFFMKETGEESKDSPFTKIETLEDLGLKKDYGKVLSISYANTLINRHLGIKKEILEEVGSFQQKHFRDKTVLALHYRSTDKAGEAPTVPYEVVKKNLEHYISLYPATDAIFLSTDDKNFHSYLSSEFTSRPLLAREDYFRSSDQSSIHGNKQLDKYQMNRDALVNCLLLSRCNALMKSSSILSDWSKLFNPTMPVILLNRPFNNKLWFPASQIVKEVLYSPI